MLKLVICDDEKVYRNDLKRIVGTELDLRGIQYQLLEFGCGEDLASASDLAEFHIIFLDIEMKHLNGVDTARKIRLKNKDAVIIFVTSHPDFVFQGYEVRALNYILKPYDRTKILSELDAALTAAQVPSEQYYLIETRGKSVRLPLDHVKYFFSDKRSVTAVSVDETYVFYGKLNDIELEIPSYFVRIHNRYLINLKYLQSIEGTNAIIDNELLPVSRSSKQALSIAFAKYMLH